MGPELIGQLLGGRRGANLAKCLGIAYSGSE